MNIYCQRMPKECVVSEAICSKIKPIANVPEMLCQPSWLWYINSARKQSASMRDHTEICDFEIVCLAQISAHVCLFLEFLIYVKCWNNFMFAYRRHISPWSLCAHIYISTSKYMLYECEKCVCDEWQDLSFLCFCCCSTEIE